MKGSPDKAKEKIRITGRGKEGSVGGEWYNLRFVGEYKNLYSINTLKQGKLADFDGVKESGETPRKGC